MVDTVDALWEARDRLNTRLNNQGQDEDVIEVEATDLRRLLSSATWLAPDGWPSSTTCLAFMQRMLRDQDPADARRIVTWLSGEFQEEGE